jgi:hypothetical protein
MTLRQWVPTGSPPPSGMPRLTRRSSYSGPTLWNTCSAEVWVRNIVEHFLRTPSKRSSTGSSIGCGASDRPSGHTARKNQAPGATQLHHEGRNWQMAEELPFQFDVAIVNT